MFRLNPRTGETCGIQNGPSGLAWAKVAEANPLAAGNYDVGAVSIMRNKQGSTFQFRIEQNTGQTWAMNGPAWEAVAEPTGAATLPTSKLGYRLALSSAGGLWGGFRINRETGAAWAMNLTSGKPTWTLMPDKPALAAGDYQIQAVAYAGDSPGAIAFKIERQTGWIWVSTDLSNWQSVAEDSTFPKPPLPKAGFRLVTGASSVSWDAYRINPESGQTWHPVYQGVAFIDQDLSEPAPIPSGDYDLKMTSTVENNVGKVGLIRLNRQTGAAWHKVDTAWQPIADKSPAPAAKSQKSAGQLVLLQKKGLLHLNKEPPMARNARIRIIVESALLVLAVAYFLGCAGSSDDKPTGEPTTRTGKTAPPTSAAFG